MPAKANATVLCDCGSTRQVYVRVTRDWRHPPASYCSKTCRGIAERGPNPRKSSGRHSDWIPRADRMAAYERDDYRCHICGENVDMDAHWNDDWAPSLDHIEARHIGGGHSLANVRTAHRWCNSVKSRRPLDTARAMLSA